MGDEADAMWDREMIEEGFEFSNECLSQCDRWPSCACGYDMRKRPYDPCGRKQRPTPHTRRIAFTAALRSRTNER